MPGVVTLVSRHGEIHVDVIGKMAFDGAPILYSWPSNTGENPIGYTAAQNNNDWTVAHLEWFLRDVTAKTGATRIHLIAHSMGRKVSEVAVSFEDGGDLIARRRFNA